MLRKENLGIKNYIIYQDDELYKFTSDAVLLSRFATIKKNDYIADFCAGSGIVGIHLFALNENIVKKVVLFEMQNSLYELSVKSIVENNLSDKIEAVNVKLQIMGAEYNGKFSLIVVNPPYLETFRGFHAPKEQNENISVCINEITLTLSELCVAASKALKYGGRFALCHRADRLCDVVKEMQKNNIEPKRLQFVYSGTNNTPYLILVEGVKGGKSGLKILENIRN